jgi:Ni,Fe-hydrogenase I cytochrome b subunit
MATPRLATPFLVLLLLPLSLIVDSFFLFRGRRIFHWLQVLNILCLIWTGFVGGMAVTGHWL